VNPAVDVRVCARSWVVSVYLGAGCSCWSGPRSGPRRLGGGNELVDAWRGVDFQVVEDVVLGLGDLGALAEGAGRSGEGADVDAVEFAAQFGPGAAGGVFSAIRASRSASQHKMTWARMRSSLRW
jgi:hypothetical protein